MKMKQLEEYIKAPFISRISVSQRIVLSGIVLFVGFVFAVFVFVHTFSEDLYAEKKNGMEQIVSLATNAIEPILADRRNGKITLAQARIKATEAVRRFVYADNNGANFLFLTTYDGYLLVEPSSPQDVGTYQMQRRDQEGVLITRALLQKARTGGGFVEHTEARASGGTPEKKISFVTGIPEIECFVGTGMFVNDLENAIRKLLLELFLLGFLIFAFVFGIQYYFLKPLLYCVGVLSDSFKQLSEDPSWLLPLNSSSHLRNPNTREMIDNFSAMLYRLQMHQKKMEQHAEKFRQIAHIATDVIWQWEGATGKTLWSENLREIIGELPESDAPHFEVVEDWVHVSDREKRRHLLAQYLGGQTEAYVCEYRIKSEDGSYRWVQVRGVATFDESRTPVRMVGSLIDLTEFMSQPSVDKGLETGNISGQISQTVERVVLQTPSVQGTSLVIDVKNRLDAEKWPGFVIVDRDVPVGLVMKSSLNQQLSIQYGVSLYYNRPVTMVMDRGPLIVDVDSPLERVSTLAQSRTEEKLYDLIVVTREGKYLGTVSVMALLTLLTDIRIQLAANANPLTGLAGNRVIDEKIQLAVRSKTPFAALYLDLDNFKAFNDKYGFERGDAVLRLTADILKEITAAYAEQDVFVGHIGGDDFILLLSGNVPCASVASRIIHDFDVKIPDLYSPEDRTRKSIVVKNRKGHIEEYPIVTISIAVVDSAFNKFTSHLEVAEVAANLKRRAKSMEGSVWVSDRRTYNDNRE